MSQQELIRAIVKEAIEEAMPNEYLDYIRYQVERQKRRDARIEEIKRQIFAAAILGFLGLIFTGISKSAQAVLSLPGVKNLLANTWLGKVIHIEQIL